MKDDREDLITDTKKFALHFMDFLKKILNNIKENITSYKKII